jgi:hypothetical protein
MSHESAKLRPVTGTLKCIISETTSN